MQLIWRMRKRRPAGPRRGGAQPGSIQILCAGQGQTLQQRGQTENTKGSGQLTEAGPAGAGLNLCNRIDRPKHTKVKYVYGGSHQRRRTTLHVQVEELHQPAGIAAGLILQQH